MKDREKLISRGSILGIIANLILFIIKFLVGFLTGSVSVTADSFNNLSDMGASAVSIIGLRLASKPSDDEHPFGHGRIEYIAGFIVSIIILLLGVELLQSAFDKIMHPAAVEASLVTLLLLCLTIPVKLGLAAYNHRIGRLVNSPTMLAAAKDSLNDVLVTAATIISMIFSAKTTFPLDGAIGLVVAALVIFAGIGVLRDTLGPLLGQAPPKEMAETIVSKILTYDGIIGVHDLILHNYGPEKYMGSVHAEVRADCDILKIHDTIDLIERRVLEEMGILLSIHLDPVDTDDALTNALREKTEKIVAAIDGRLSMHDFRIVSGDTHINLIFDIAMPRAVGLRESEIKARIDREVQAGDREIFTVITFDHSFIG